MPIAERLVWWIVVATTLIVPMLLSITGSDVFRLPKQLMLIATSIAVAAIIMCSRIAGGRFGDATRWPRHVPVVVVTTLLWCALTSLISTNRALSINSLLMVAAAAMSFVAAYVTLQRRGAGIVYLAATPALLNALVAIGQRTGLWEALPTQSSLQGRSGTIALLGNANDVGMFLVAPALALAALAIVSKRHRTPAAIALLILIAGLIASETVGAITALSAGLFVMFRAVKPRAIMIVVLVVVLFGFAFIRLSPARWAMTQVKFEAIAQADADRLLSGRMPAFLAAWRMFVQHPVFGVGLGCFPFHYFDQKIAVEVRHPQLMDRHPENFGEVHNEHLQILAEAGVPAYAIFIAALVILARVSFRDRSSEAGLQPRLAGRLALPLAVALAVLSLSSFPLRVAAPAHSILLICAMTLAWSEHARD